VGGKGKRVTRYATHGRLLYSALRMDVL